MNVGARGLRKEKGDWFDECEKLIKWLTPNEERHGEKK